MDSNGNGHPRLGSEPNAIENLRQHPEIEDIDSEHSPFTNDYKRSSIAEAELVTV